MSRIWSSSRPASASWDNTPERRRDGSVVESSASVTVTGRSHAHQRQPARLESIVAPSAQRNQQLFEGSHESSRRNSPPNMVMPIGSSSFPAPTRQQHSSQNRQSQQKQRHAWDYEDEDDYGDNERGVNSREQSMRRHHSSASQRRQQQPRRVSHQFDSPDDLGAAAARAAVAGSGSAASGGFSLSNSQQMTSGGSFHFPRDPESPARASVADLRKRRSASVVNIVDSQQPQYQQHQESETAATSDNDGGGGGFFHPAAAAAGGGRSSADSGGGRSPIPTLRASGSFSEKIVAQASYSGIFGRRPSPPLNDEQQLQHQRTEHQQDDENQQRIQQQLMQSSSRTQQPNFAATTATNSSNSAGHMGRMITTNNSNGNENPNSNNNNNHDSPALTASTTNWVNALLACDDAMRMKAATPQEKQRLDNSALATRRALLAPALSPLPPLPDNSDMVDSMFAEKMLAFDRDNNNINNNHLQLQQYHELPRRKPPPPPQQGNSSNGDVHPESLIYDDHRGGGGGTAVNSPSAAAAGRPPLSPRNNSNDKHYNHNEDDDDEEQLAVEPVTSAVAAQLIDAVDRMIRAQQQQVQQRTREEQEHLEEAEQEQQQRKQRLTNTFLDAIVQAFLREEGDQRTAIAMDRFTWFHEAMSLSAFHAREARARSALAEQERRIRTEQFHGRIFKVLSQCARLVTAFGPATLGNVPLQDEPEDAPIRSVIALLTRNRPAHAVLKEDKTQHRQQQQQQQKSRQAVVNPDNAAVFPSSGAVALEWFDTIFDKQWNGNWGRDLDATLNRVMTTAVLQRLITAECLKGGNDSSRHNSNTNNSSALFRDTGSPLLHVPNDFLAPMETSFVVVNSNNNSNNELPPRSPRQQVQQTQHRRGSSGSARGDSPSNAAQFLLCDSLSPAGGGDHVDPRVPAFVPRPSPSRNQSRRSSASVNQQQTQQQKQNPTTTTTQGSAVMTDNISALFAMPSPIHVGGNNIATASPSPSRGVGAAADRSMGMFSTPGVATDDADLSLDASRIAAEALAATTTAPIQAQEQQQGQQQESARRVLLDVDAATPAGAAAGGGNASSSFTVSLTPTPGGAKLAETAGDDDDVDVDDVDEL